MNAKVAVFGTLRFPPGRMDEVLPHLRQLIEATYKSDGCIAYEAALDPFDRGLVRFSELWPDQESLSRHLQAPHIAPWRAASRHCGLLDRQFVAYEVSGSREI
jgi:quinol monooxygenase YgiN